MVGVTVDIGRPQYRSYGGAGGDACMLSAREASSTRRQSTGAPRPKDVSVVRQVSWLAGHRRCPAFPAASASDQWGDNDSPLTVAGAARASARCASPDSLFAPERSPENHNHESQCTYTLAGCQERAWSILASTYRTTNSGSIRASSLPDRVSRAGNRRAAGEGATAALSRKPISVVVPRGVPTDYGRGAPRR